jgi:tryptophan synthase alpha chain
LPIAVGFGIRSPEQAASVARVADAAAVGSALVQRLAEHVNAAGKPDAGLVTAVLDDVRALAAGVRGARQNAVLR